MRRRALGTVRHTRQDLIDIGHPPPDAGAACRRPLVSIVIATYNRSNVLRFALESLVAQSLTDWEALVVGDACTDDTAQVVAGFADRRLLWWNLERNLGDQSGPNSVGARWARGRYLAWLNHDDLWLPSHLERLVDRAETGGLDCVASGWINVGPARDVPADSNGGSAASSGIEAEQWGARVRRGVHPADVYPASSWLVRRDLVARVGDWRCATELRAASSQDFLYRCWAAGARMRLGGAPSLVAIQSGRFAGSYVDRRDREHRRIAPLVARCSADELLALLQASPAAPYLPRRERWRMERGERSLATSIAREGAMTMLLPAAARMGMGPAEVKARLRGAAPGSWIADLHAVRGLDRR